MGVRCEPLQKVTTLTIEQQKKSFFFKKIFDPIYIWNQERTKEDIIKTYKIYVENQIYNRIAEARG